MKVITINLPEPFLSAIQILVERGVYPSRSEAIRIALRDFLSGDLKFYSDLNPESFNMFLLSGGRIS